MLPLILNAHMGGDIMELLTVPDRDRANEPVMELSRQLQIAGFTMAPFAQELLPQTDWIIVWDAYSVQQPLDLTVESIRSRVFSVARGRRPIDLRSIKDRFPSIKTALIAFEPPLICPQNFDDRYTDVFDVVFSWSSDRCRLVNHRKIIIPSPDYAVEESKVPFQDRRLLVDITSNKRIAGAGALSDFRLELIRHFSERYPEDFDLYGFGWNLAWSDYLGKKGLLVGLGRAYSEKISSYRGVLRDKEEALKHYRFVLCAENSSLPDFVSMKFLDALRLGCIPVYLGATNMKELFDPSMFIDISDFSTVEDLAIKLSSVDRLEYSSMRNTFRQFWRSKDADRFKTEFFVKSIFEGMEIQDPPVSLGSQP